MNLDDLGLNAPRLIAGFAGGVVHAIVFKERNPGAVIGSVIAGTLTANFLSPLVAHYASFLGDGSCAFLVGLTAMAICQGLVSLVRAKTKEAVGKGETRETPP